MGPMRVSLIQQAVVVIQDIGIGGSKSNGFVVMIYGFIPSPQPHEHISEAQVGLREIRIQPRSRLKMGQSVTRVTLRIQENSKILVRQCAGGIFFQGVDPEGFRRSESPGFPIDCNPEIQAEERSQGGHDRPRVQIQPFQSQYD